MDLFFPRRGGLDGFGFVVVVVVVADFFTTLTLVFVIVVVVLDVVESGFVEEEGSPITSCC